MKWSVRGVSLLLIHTLICEKQRQKIVYRPSFFTLRCNTCRLFHYKAIASEICRCLVRFSVTYPPPYRCFTAWTADLTVVVMDDRTTNCWQSNLIRPFDRIVSPHTIVTVVEELGLHTADRSAFVCMDFMSNVSIATILL
jgi:hypothetical protein